MGLLEHSEWQLKRREECLALFPAGHPQAFSQSLRCSICHCWWLNTSVKKKHSSARELLSALSFSSSNWAKNKRGVQAAPWELRCCVLKPVMGECTWVNLYYQRGWCSCPQGPSLVGCVSSLGTVVCYAPKNVFATCFFIRSLWWLGRDFWWDAQITNFTCVPVFLSLILAMVVISAGMKCHLLFPETNADSILTS